MPVRIYDIAKKLGIESKVVLAKAKELGITPRQGRLQYARQDHRRIPRGAAGRRVGSAPGPAAGPAPRAGDAGPSCPPVHPPRPAPRHRSPRNQRPVRWSTAAPAPRPSPLGRGSRNPPNRHLSQTRRPAAFRRRIPPAPAMPVAEPAAADPVELAARRPLPPDQPPIAATPPQPPVPSRPACGRSAAAPSWSRWHAGGAHHSQSPAPAADRARPASSPPRPAPPRPPDGPRQRPAPPMAGGRPQLSRDVRAPGKPDPPPPPKFVAPTTGHADHPSSSRRSSSAIWRRRSAEAVPTHRRPHGAGGLRQRQPVDRRADRPVHLRQATASGSRSKSASAAPAQRPRPGQEAVELDSRTRPRISSCAPR